MFPEKIEFDGKNYRTKSYNKMLDIIYQETKQLQGHKKKKSPKNTGDFGRVPADFIFSNRVLEDLERIWALRFIIPDPCNPNTDSFETKSEE